MDNTNFQDLLVEQLFKLFPEAKVDGGRNNVLINCPLCEREGRKDTNRHMNICLGNDNKPLFYNCFRNNTHKGILTSANLEKLAERSLVRPDPGFLELLDEVVKKTGNISKYKLRNNGTYYVRTGRVVESDLNEVKRLYVCKRIGLDLSLAELSKNKIIFSIKDLLSFNFINRLTRSEYTVDLLDKYFVGFLTHNNGSIILRNMVLGKVELPESVNERYIKYSIIQGSPVGYYIIPSQCDIYKHIDVHIAEGTFDILSIFYNLREANRINNIYASIGGNSYTKVIEFFLCQMGLINITFHIYPDMDIKKHVLPSIKNILAPLNIDCYIHMNASPGEKDFGVPKEKIKEYVYKLI